MPLGGVKWQLLSACTRRACTLWAVISRLLVLGILVSCFFEGRRAGFILKDVETTCYLVDGSTRGRRCCKTWLDVDCLFGDDSWR